MIRFTVTFRIATMTNKLEILRSFFFAPFEFSVKGVNVVVEMYHVYLI